MISNCVFLQGVCFLCLPLFTVLNSGLFTFVFACLFSRERKKEDIELGGWRGRENLGGTGEGETVIRIYCTKIVYFQ